MNKDTLKTLAGLAVIVVIIAGAFWYGDRQHQQQLSQNQKATSSAAPTAPLGTKSPTPKPTATKSTSAKTPSATPAPTPVVAVTTPTAIPQTGAASDLVPLAVLSGAWVLYRRSARHAATQTRTTRAI